MSSNPLFADSSSDEGDDVPMTTPDATNTEEASKSDKPAPAENESSKKDDVETKDSTNDKEEKNETKEGNDGGDTSKSARPSLFDDDSDDSDAEFDDKGEVEGSSAPVQVNTPEPTIADEATEAASTPSAKNSSKPPERATMLQPERPDEGVTLHMTKLPNLVALQPVAFDEDTYIAQEEEEQYKGYVHNMIRWRYKQNENGEMERDASGNLVRESNSKLVKWDDGSYTLHIGGEAFTIQTVDSTKNGFAGLNGYVHLSQKATFRSNDGKEDEVPGTVLECIAPVASRLIPKPSSLQSEAHKGLTVAVRQRTIKRARIAEYVTQEDPEKLKADRIRTNQDEDKIRARKKSIYRSGSSRRRMPGMNRRYMEEDDGDYDTTNIGAMKKGMAMEDDMDDYGDESDDDYDDTFRNRNRKKQKRALEEQEDEDEEELVFDIEDDDDDVGMVKAHKKKRSHQAVLDDDSD
eukprot:scaffold2047_cov129-Cylindrotheca_fusiformis.AAC.21